MDNTFVLETGKVLYREGEVAQFLYFIQKGKISLVHSLTGNNVVDKTFEAGEFVADISIFSGNLLNHTAIAVEETTLVRIPKEEIQQALSEKGEWVGKLMGNLADKIHSSILDIREHDIEGPYNEKKPLEIEIKD